MTTDLDPQQRAFRDASDAGPKPGSRAATGDWARAAAVPAEQLRHYPGRLTRIEVDA